MSNQSLDFRGLEIDYLKADLKRYGVTTLKGALLLLASKPQTRVVLFYRLSRAFRGAKGFSRILFPVCKIFHRWACASLNCEIPLSCDIGPGLKIYHGYCLVINADARIGSNFTVQHSVTIGSTQKGTPVISDNVEIGTQVAIIGKVHVGSHAIVGAGSVIVKDVESYAVVVGNPQRVVRVQGGLAGDTFPTSEVS